MRARSNTVFAVVSLVAVGIAVAVGWSTRTRAQEGTPPAPADESEQVPPQITYDQLSPTPKTTPTVIGDRGDGQGVPAAVAQANSTESKADVDAIRAFWEKDRAKVKEAWRGFMVEKAKEALAKKAEYEAAAAGLGSAGVK